MQKWVSVKLGKFPEYLQRKLNEVHDKLARLGLFGASRRMVHVAVIYSSQG
jgi:hypothetical protein